MSDLVASKQLVERHLAYRAGWLRAANDGILSTASLVLGVAAAGASRVRLRLPAWPDSSPARRRWRPARSPEQPSDARSESIRRLSRVGGCPLQVSGDPADDVILACAVEAGTDVLATGDRQHLLPAGAHRRVPHSAR